MKDRHSQINSNRSQEPQRLKVGSIRKAVQLRLAKIRGAIRNSAKVLRRSVSAEQIAQILIQIIIRIIIYIITKHIP